MFASLTHMKQKSRNGGVKCVDTVNMHKFLTPSNHNEDTTKTPNNKHEKKRKLPMEE